MLCKDGGLNEKLGLHLTSRSHLSNETHRLWISKRPALLLSNVESNDDGVSKNLVFSSSESSRPTALSTLKKLL